MADSKHYIKFVFEFKHKAPPICTFSKLMFYHCTITVSTKRATANLGQPARTKITCINSERQKLETMGRAKQSH